MDLSNPTQIRERIAAIKPDVIVNPAAYTLVDPAEHETALANQINAVGPAVIAEQAARLGAVLIHYSTDYVFDGTHATPYTEDDLPNPLNVYGKSKLAGECAVRRSECAHLILRTSWVYGLHGKNFLRTIQRLAQERDELRIVADQFGAPTWAATIADTTAAIIAQANAQPDPAHWWRAHSGTYHLSSRGQTSWHAFARAIVDSMPMAKKPTVTPIATSEFPTTASRPLWSVLDCSKLTNTFHLDLPEWRSALQACLASADV